ncbi:MAG: ChaN family lipoprotein [Desulfobacterales bacterium]
MRSARLQSYGLVAAALALSACAVLSAAADPDVFDLESDRRRALSDIVPGLLKGHIVLVGEHHATAAHHRAQLRVIRALHEAGARVVIGLEMFRQESQDVLDRWVAGNVGPQEFQAAFTDNWGFPWAEYRPVFEYARTHNLRMVGLNVPRSITRQVARGGFQSLSQEQRGQLSDVTCSVDADYMRYIRSAYGAHAHGTTNFTFFCEAQMVWDAAMAVHALNAIQADPEAVVVILTGVGHAQKGAVPRQIRQRTAIPTMVFLPEVPGTITPSTVDEQDADYLLLDLR